MLKLTQFKFADKFSEKFASSFPVKHYENFNLMTYVYAIIKINNEKSNVFRNFEKIEKFRSMVADEIYTINHQDIACVVSRLPFKDYTSIFKETLLKELVNHQKVIEEIMSNHTVIPVKFGTFIDNDDNVRLSLSKGYRIINDIFNKMSDMIEMNVIVKWNNFNSVLTEIGHEKDILDAKQNLINKAENVTIEDKIKLGIMVQDFVNKRIKEYTLRIETSLDEIVESSKSQIPEDDKTIGNFAFLINKNKFEDFNKKIEELNCEFNEQLNFKIIGPLPTYNFYAFEIKKMQFEEIDWCRKKLGLDITATKEEIRRAHQMKALLTHPDRNPDKENIASEFDESTRAYKIISDYCQDDFCSFKKEDFEKNSIIVRICE